MSDSHERGAAAANGPNGAGAERTTAELRVLVLAPLQNDANLTAGFLGKSGLMAEVCVNSRDLCDKLVAGCGAVLAAEEALDPDAGQRLMVALTQQPSWSDIPIIVVTSGAGEVSRARLRWQSALRAGGKITLLERPFRPLTLISTLETALRSRRRQYQVRDLLLERARISAQAERQARVYDTILSTITDFAYILDREGRFVFANRALLELFDTSLESVVGKGFAELNYPADLARRLTEQVRRVFATGQPLRDETEYTSRRGVTGYFDYILSPVFGADGRVEVVVGSTRDVTDRRKSEEALRVQAEMLRLADRRKDEFLAMLAHELRNPLASVLAAATVLQNTADAENLQWATGVIDRQGGQLGRLIDDLLDVSRITSGKIRLRMERLDAASALERACETVRPLCREKAHLLKCDFPTGELWVNADPTRLEQIVTNLLTNAAKYTPAGGRIEVLATRAEGRVKIIVRDNGVGIAPERIPEMFELFAQGERSIARSEGGLGIGLTIVKRLTELHGGDIQAHSEGTDRGTSFVLALPAAAAPTAGEAQTATARTVVPRHGLCILVVDDNHDTAEGLARILRRDGHKVTVASDGPEALEQADEIVPEVVLLDIGLPGLDGYKVAERIRQKHSMAAALLVAISGYGQDEDRRRSSAAGFDHHFVKPVKLDELRTLIMRRAR